MEEIWTYGNAARKQRCSGHSSGSGKKTAYGQRHMTGPTGFADDGGSLGDSNQERFIRS
jgi:hypothetical protein